MKNEVKSRRDRKKLNVYFSSDDGKASGKNTKKAKGTTSNVGGLGKSKEKAQKLRVGGQSPSAQRLSCCRVLKMKSGKKHQGKVQNNNQKSEKKKKKKKKKKKNREQQISCREPMKRGKMTKK